MEGDRLKPLTLQEHTFWRNFNVSHSFLWITDNTVSTEFLFGMFLSNCKYCYNRVWNHQIMLNESRLPTVEDCRAYTLMHSTEYRKCKQQRVRLWLDIWSEKACHEGDVSWQLAEQLTPVSLLTDGNHDLIYLLVQTVMSCSPTAVRAKTVETSLYFFAVMWRYVYVQQHAESGPWPCKGPPTCPVCTLSSPDECWL